MRIRWRAREYERTCDQCGCSWRAPRSGQRKPISGFSVAPRGVPQGLATGQFNPVVPDSDPELVSSEAISKAAAAFGRCPKCGSDRYTQRLVRS